MEGLIALSLLYWMWKSTVEAVVNIVALAKGRSVARAGAEHEAEKYRQYVGRGIGTVIGALVWAAAEAAKTAFAAADAKYGARIEDRRRARRGRPGPAAPAEPVAGPGPGPDPAPEAPAPTCYLCGYPSRDGDPLRPSVTIPADTVAHRSCLRDPAGDGTPRPKTPGTSITCDTCGDPPRRGDPLVPVGTPMGDTWAHRSCTDDDEAPVCTGCHQEIGYGEAVGTADGEWVHQWCRCATCHRAGTDGDPLVAHEGAYRHQSHLGGPEAPEAAEVVDDATGQALPAVWELGPARSWASVPTGRTTHP